MSAGTQFKKTRVSVPAMERMKQLYAFGYSNSEMSEILNQEFSDIEFDTFSPNRIKDTISVNIEEFNRDKMKLTLKCQEDIQLQIQAMFSVVGTKEILMVEVYAEKLQNALTSLRDLDLDEIDEDTGNYKNTARIFVLIEMAEKLQSKIAKIVGTDALRDIEIYKAKMAIKSEADNKQGGLIPAFGREVNSGTRFLD